MAENESEIERILVEVARPTALQVLSRYSRLRHVLSQADADDIVAIVSLRVLERLRAGDPIQDVRGFTATLTYNIVADHLRRKFPRRARLKNRLRYLLTHDERFLLSMSSGVMSAGLSRWSDRAVRADIPPMRTSGRMLQRDSGDALHAVLTEIGSPVDFDALVDFMASLWNVGDQPAVDISEVVVGTQDEPVSLHLERRERLAALWSEIRQLPPAQRRALLLNLREASTVNVLTLLVLTRAASFDEVAETLEMAPEALAEIWNRLPLDDLAIAEMLGLTRQQVINLRKSARERLHRKLSGKRS